MSTDPTRRTVTSGYVVAARESPPLWGTRSGERVFAERGDAEWYQRELESVCPDLVGRLGIFQAYVVILRESDE